MPIVSSQVSGLIGNQQVMFGNQAAFSQQIGGMHGTGPYPQGVQMQAPSFGMAGYGGQVVGSDVPGGAGAVATGTMAQMVPGMAAGVSLAGGFIGGRAGWADPFTASGRMFARGIGAGGTGVGGTLETLGAAFRGAGGLPRGLGMLGRGLAFGGAAALPFLAAGEALSYGAGQVSQGAQNIAQVETVMGRQGPMYGQAGVRPGGRISRSEIQNITEVLHTFTEDPEMKATMGQLTRLMGQAQQGGMLTGVMNAADFRNKFGKIVQQVKGIAQIMGTSLEEAMPMLGQMKQMGLWRTSDIMGTAHAMNMVGPQAAPQMLGAMQQGAQMSWAQGGRMAQGAAMGRQSFLQVQSAMRSGVLPEEALMEITGGVGGVEGQRMMAGKLTQGVSTFAQGSMGRLMMAGLAERNEEGTFTGRISQERLQQFMGGQIGIGRLQQMGRAATGTKQGATSFSLRQGQIGQEMMAQGGMGAVGEAIEQVMEKAGYGGASEEIRATFIQKLMGVNARDAEMWRRMLDDLPRIEEENNRRARDAIRDSFERLEHKQNRSWQGFKESLAHASEQTIARPLQEAGERLTTSLNQRFDRLSNMFWGRRQRINISRRERVRTLAQQDIGDMPTLEGMGVGAGGELRMDTSMAEQLRRDPGGLLRQGALGAIGSLAGPEGIKFMQGLGEEVWTRAGAMRNLGAETTEQMVRTARRASMRAQSPTLSGLGYSKADYGDKVSKIGAAIRKSIVKPSSAIRLRELRKKYGSNESAYAREFLKELEGDSDVKAAMEGMSTDEKLDMVAIAQQQAGINNEMAFNATRLAQEYGFAGLPDDPEELKALAMEKRTELASMVNKANEASTTAGARAGLESLTNQALTSSTAGSVISALSSVGEAALAMRGGAGIGEVASGLISGKYGVSGVLSEGVGKMFDVEGLSQEDISEAVSNEEWGADLLEWLSKGKGDDIPGNKFLDAAVKRGDPKAKNIKKKLDELMRQDPSKLMAVAGQMQKIRTGTIRAREIERRKTLAGREQQNIGALAAKGVSKDIRDRYNAVLTAHREGNVEEAVRLSESLAEDLKGQRENLAAIGGQGAVGMQIQRLSRLEEFEGRGGKLSAKEFSRQFGRLRLGVGGIEGLMRMRGDLREEIEGMLEGGVDKDERRRISEMARETMGRLGPQEGRAQVGKEEKLYNLLTAYATANEKFVWAVTQSIGAMDVEEVDRAKKGLSKDKLSPSDHGG